jgi:protein-tyrosine phosphatase
MVKVLFVCLGNICRSPLAEGIFDEMVKEQGLEDRISCDSCGMAAYHISSQPDSRTVANAKENGLELNHQARQFDGSDLDKFDQILVMDRANYEEVRQFFISEGHASKVRLMRAYDLEEPNKDVPDPYYGGDQGFQEVYDILYRSCGELLSKVRGQL